jgi:hypothetical protein
MKKLFTLWIAVVMAATAVTAAPKQAEAAIGIVGIGTPIGIPLVVAGGITTAAALVFDYTLLIACALTHCGPGEVVLAIAVVAAGVVLLDPQEGPLLKYQELGADEAATLGITPDELASFNSQVDELNAVSQTIGSELTKIKNPKIEDSRALWAAYQGSLDPAAYSAAGKVTEAWLKSLKVAGR